MADQTPAQRIAQLEAENAALKATAGNPLHPDVQPRFYNGSFVHHAGQLQRVVGRSIDANGACAYTIEDSDETRTYDVAEDELKPADEAQLSRGAKVAIGDAASDSADAAEAVAIRKE